MGILSILWSEIMIVNASWIEDRTELICPICKMKFKDEILYMTNDDRFKLQYCPHCGAKLRFKDE